MTNVYDDQPPDDTYNNVTPLRPHTNRAAEQALITTILRYPETAPDLINLVNPDDFHWPEHETIWTAYQTVLAQGLIPDHIAVNAQLAKQPAARRPRLEEYLADNTTPTLPTQADYYASLVREAAGARRATTDANRVHLQLQAATDTASVENALADALDIFEHHTRTLYSGGTTNTTPLHADLTGILTGGIPQPAPPTICRRQDGHHLFYPGRVNGLYGDPESAKSWIAQMGIVETITTGGRATLIDVDHNGPAATAARLANLGAPPHLIANPDHFRYYEPDDRDELLATINQTVTWQPHIAILDSLGELLPMYGASSVDNDEITDALRHLANPLANTGACVITIDHLPKNAEARTSGYAIGGTAKKRAMDGTLIHVDTKTPAAPGQTGRMVLRIEKDRPGRLREVSSGKYAGTFILDSTGPTIIATIDMETAPTDETGTRRYTIFMEKISRYVEDHDQATFNDICDAVKGTEKYLRTAVKALIDEGFIATFPGPRRSTLHHSIAHYREAEDDHA